MSIPTSMTDLYFTADGWNHTAILQCEREQCMVLDNRGGVQWWTADIDHMTLDEVSVMYTEHLKTHTEETR